MVMPVHALLIKRSCCLLPASPEGHILQLAWLLVVCQHLGVGAVGPLLGILSIALTALQHLWSSVLLVHWCGAGQGVEGQRGSRVGPYQAAVLLMSYEYICTSAGCTAGDSVVKTVAWCVWCTRPAAGQVLQRYDSQGTAHSAQAHRHTGTQG
jgi:hypothetical protein